MPQVATSSSTLTHSCSWVYRRSLFFFFAIQPSFRPSGSFPSIAAVVAEFDKWHLRHLRRVLPAPHDDPEIEPDLCLIAFDVAHGHRAANRRAEAAAGDLSHACPCSIDDLDVLACYHSPFGSDAYPLPLHALPKLALHDFRTGEAAAFPAALADRPGEPRFDRRRSLVQIVAIQAEPGLKPQRIARTEPRGLHLILVEQLPREALGLVGRNRHLEAVLPRVA